MGGKRGGPRGPTLMETFSERGLERERPLVGSIKEAPTAGMPRNGANGAQGGGR